MSKFEILGRFRIRNEWRPFSKYVEGRSEKMVMEKVLSQLGSEHGLKRNLIKIDEVRCLE